MKLIAAVGRLPQALGITVRDLSRIESVLSGLREVWSQHPDLRLGQLVVIASRPKTPCPDIFYLEDEALIDGLRAYAQNAS
jgi:hypothetical protein